MEQRQVNKDPECKVCGKQSGQVEAMYPAFGRGGYLCNHCAVINGGAGRSCGYCGRREERSDRLRPQIFEKSIYFVCSDCHDSHFHCSNNGGRDSAEECLSRIEADPLDGRLRLRAAFLLLRAGNTAEAIDQYLLVGEQFEREEFYTGAIAAYKTVLEMRPSLTSLYHLIGENYHRLGYALDAIYHYRAAAQKFEIEGRNPEAVNAWERIVQKNPSNLNARHKLAEMLYRCGWEEEALENYREVRALLIEAGRSEQLVSFYEKMLSVIPSAIEETCMLARAYLDDDDAEAALDLLRKHIDLGVSDSTVYDLYAEARLEIARRNGEI